MQESLAWKQFSFRIHSYKLIGSINKYCKSQETITKAKISLCTDDISAKPLHKSGQKAFMQNLEVLHLSPKRFK